MKSFVPLTNAPAMQCALLSTSYLDKALLLLIERRLCPNSATKELVGSPNGPLGTAGGRRQLAHALGLVSDATNRNVKLLQKVRNHFAHEYDDPTFENRTIISLCMSLPKLASLPMIRGEKAPLPLRGEDEELPQPGALDSLQAQRARRRFSTVIASETVTMLDTALITTHLPSHVIQL